MASLVDRDSEPSQSKIDGSGRSKLILGVFRGEDGDGDDGCGTGTDFREPPTASVMDRDSEPLQCTVDGGGTSNLETT
jgi:hypothetical protein